MDITITIPDAKAVEVRDVLCVAWNYDTTKIGNETKAAFLKRKIAEHIKNEFIIAKANAQAEAAKETVRTTEQNIAIV